METWEINLNAHVLPVWKRIIDVGCCVVALPFLVIVSLVAIVTTKLTSPGPIFFRQERIGYRGRRFLLYKFRTMHANSDASVHHAHLARLMKSDKPMEKLDGRDPRLIPGASLWRASGLDELPQILNVLRGEMSIVGPRPCIPYEYQAYSEAQRARFNCLPGLTGLWQVSGKNRTTFEKMVQLDIEYGRRLSLGFDLRIILKTLPVLWAQISDTQRVRELRKRFAGVEPLDVDAGTPAKSAPAPLPRFANTLT